MSDGAYDDALTPEEEAQLKTDQASTALPQAEDGDNPPPADPEPVAPAAQPADAGASGQAQQQGAAAAPTQAPGASEEDEFKAWLAQNGGKSPEELARIAFQQQKRANREAFQGRQATSSLQAIQQRISAAQERATAKRTEIEQRRQGFKDKLGTDPDAATADLHEQMLTREAEEADAEVHNARIDAAIGLARQAIPDFDKRAPEIFSFGTEMGYSPEEVRGISDGRDIVTLYLASVAGKMFRAGMIDLQGNLLQQAAPVAQTDARLQAPAAPVQTLSSAPARSNGAGKSAEQIAQDMMSMSDEDFDKLPPGQLENLLRNLG